MRQYLVVLEETETGYSAYYPDVPGCVATGSTREEVERNIREALEFHLKVSEKKAIPCPSQRATPVTSRSLPERHADKRANRVGYHGGMPKTRYL
ncbi:MAG: type II toxin-antitoxin system HicB family antitoxin [Acidobacteriota bacterium]